MSRSRSRQLAGSPRGLCSRLGLSRVTRARTCQPLSSAAGTAAWAAAVTNSCFKRSQGGACVNSHAAPAQWVTDTHQVLLHHLGLHHSSLLRCRGAGAVAGVVPAHTEESWCCCPGTLGRVSQGQLKTNCGVCSSGAGNCPPHLT